LPGDTLRAQEIDLWVGHYEGGSGEVELEAAIWQGGLVGWGIGIAGMGIGRGAVGKTTERGCGDASQPACEQAAARLIDSMEGRLGGREVTLVIAHGVFLSDVGVKMSD
jgi:hypothetical protein